jgi:hypothetical protein
MVNVLKRSSRRCARSVARSCLALPPAARASGIALRYSAQALAPPAIAGQIAARHARRRLALRASLASVLALIGVLGIANVLGGPSLALQFGNGVSGLSRALLTVELVAKPLLRTAGASGGLWMLAGLLALAGVGWLWWRMLQRTPVVYAERVV